MTANESSSAPPRGGASEEAGPLAPVDRDRILQAMTECCAERGYPETTVAEIVGRADVSRERFDELFESKEDCALAAIDKALSEALATVAGVDSTDVVELKQGVLAARELLDLISRRADFSRLALIEARQGGTPAMGARYEAGPRLLALMIERTRAIVPDNSASASAPRIAVGGVEAVLRREMAEGRASTLTRLLPDFVYGVLVPLVGQQLALRQAHLASELVAGEAE